VRIFGYPLRLSRRVAWRLNCRRTRPNITDRWDHAEALWKLNKSFDDLRNTLVVELSQLLSVSIESLQALQAIELVQRVEEL